MVDRLLHESAGEFHEQLQVRERNHVRYLRFGSQGGWQGALSLDARRKPIFAYQRAFAAIASSIPQVGSFLSLGVGTGTSLNTVRSLHPDSQLFGVEVDGAVLDIAFQFFACPAPDAARYWVRDAVEFLEDTNRQFDLVFVDLYLRNAIYQRCLEPGFAQRLKSIVTTHGIVACNLITSFPITGTMWSFVMECSRQFSSVYLVPVSKWPAFVDQNVLCICTNDACRINPLQLTAPPGEWFSAFELWLWRRRIRTLQRAVL